MYIVDMLKGMQRIALGAAGVFLALSKTRPTWIRAFCITLVSVVAVHSQEVIVYKNGDPQGTTYTTIQAAINSFGGGDIGTTEAIILIKGVGITYAENVVVDTTKVTGTTYLKPLIIRRDSTSTASIDGQNGFAIDVKGVNNVILENLKIVRSTTTRLDISGIRYQNCIGGIIRGCDVGANYGLGVWIINGDDMIIENNKIHDMDSKFTKLQFPFGLRLDTGSTGNEVKGNLIWSIMNTLSTTSYGDGIQVLAGPNYIHHNVIWSCERNGMLLDAAVDSILWNNTVDLIDNSGSAEGDGIQFQNGSNNLRLRNNIITRCDGYAIRGAGLTPGTGIDSDYNLVFANGSTFVGYTEGSNTQQNDPKYVDPTNVTVANRNFRLQSTFGHWNGTTLVGPPRDANDSPAIDSGVPPPATAITTAEPVSPPNNTNGTIQVSSVTGLPPRGFVVINGDKIRYTGIDTLTNRLTGVAAGNWQVDGSHLKGSVVWFHEFDYTAEPEDNGNRINQGAYGGTSEASLSGVSVPGGNDDAINTWTGKAGTTSWNTAGNWSKRSVPISTDKVYIPDRSFDPVLDVSTTVATLTVSNYSNNNPAVTNGTLTLSNPAYTLTVTGNLVIESGASWVHSAGAVNVAGDVTINGTFSDTGGTVTLNGSTASQTVSGSTSPTFYNLTINNTFATATVAMPAGAWGCSNDFTITSANSVTMGIGTVTIGGKLKKDSNGGLTSTSGTLNVAGNFEINAGTFNHNSGTVTMNGSANQTMVTGGTTFNVLNFSNTSSTATITVSGNLTVASTLTLTASNACTVSVGNGTHVWTGAVAVNGGTLKLAPTSASTYTASAGITVGTGGALRMDGPSTLRLPTTGLTINGSFIALAETARPKITTTGTPGTNFYVLYFNPTSASDHIDIFGLDIDSPDSNGLDINANGSAQIKRLDDINFTNGSNDSSLPNGFTNTYLTLRGVSSGSYTFRLIDFDKYCQYNVKLRGFSGLVGTSTANITMENCGGAKGDSDGSDTPAGGGDAWTGEGRDADPDGDTHITWKYFKKWVGSVNTMWSLGANWEGGTAPSKIFPYDDVLISPGKPYNPVLDEDATVNNFTIDTGGVMSLGNTGKILTIRGDNFRTFGGTMDPGNGTIVFAGPASQIVNVGVNPLYNVRIEKPGGDVNLAANLVVRNDFVLVDGTFNMNGYRMDVGDPAYGVTMAFKLDDDNDGDGTFIMGTTSALTTRRAATTNKATIIMKENASWTADDGTGANNCTITIGPSVGSGGSLSMSDGSKIVVGDGDGTDSLTAQGGASFTMTATAMGAPRLELAGGTSPASATFNSNFKSIKYTSTKPVITRRTADASGNYSITMTSGVDIQGLSISYQNASGLNISSTATITNLNFIDFSNVPSATDSGHLKIARSGAGSLVSEGCTFDSSFTIGTGGNIYVSRSDGAGGTFTLYMSNATGAGSGDSAEDTAGPTVSELAAPNATAIIWVTKKTWNGNYKYRRGITITNANASAPLPKGAPVELTFNHNALVAAVPSKSLASGDDIRVVYYDPTTGTGRELDRIIIHKNHNTGWNTANTTIVFPTAASIAPGGNSDIGTQKTYWIYYGNPNAVSPPANQSNVGVIFFEGFESNGFIEGGWTGTTPNRTTTSVRKNSGTYAGGFEISTSYLDPSNLIKSVTLTGLSNIYLYYARSTEDKGAGNVGYESAAPQGAAPFESNTNAGTTAWVLRGAAATPGFSVPSTAADFRIAARFSGTIAVGTDCFFDDIRLYANHNGVLPTVSSFDTAVEETITGLWSDPFNWSPIGVPGSNSAVAVDHSSVPYNYAPNLNTTATVTILSLELKNTLPGAMTLTASANPLVITRDITFGVPGGATTGSISNVNGRTIQVGGKWTFYAGSNFTAGTGTVIFNGGAAQTIEGSGAAPVSFNNLTVSAGPGNTTLSLKFPTDVGGSLTINASQELVVTSQGRLKIASPGATATAVTVNGTLTLENGSTLDLEGKALPDFTTLTVNIGGLLRTSGTSASSRATITSSDTTIDADGYAITIKEGSGVNLNYYNVFYVGKDGLQIEGTTALPSPGGLNNGNYDYPSNGGVLINFINYNYSGAQTISGCDFKNTGSATGAFNVRGAHKTTDIPAGSDDILHGVITFTNVTGSFSGEANDQDPNNVVSWPDTGGIKIPRIRGAVADDNSGGGMGIQFGDRVTITFFDTVSGASVSTNGFDVTSTIDTVLPLNNGHVWGTIVSATWGNKYTTGTVNVENGMSAVTGNGTTWTKSILVGETFQVSGDSTTYKVLAVNSDTSLTLDAPYAGSTQTGAGYTVTGPNNSRLVITLGSGATVAVGDTIANAANFGGIPPNTIMDPTNTSTGQGTNSGAGTAQAITGSFGADNPDMILAIADDPKATQVAGADPGDVVVIRFSKPVNAFPITSTSIDTVLKPAGGTHTWGSPITATYSGTVTNLTAAYTGTGTLTVADTSKFPASVSTPNTVFVNGDDFTYTGKTATTFTGVAGLGNMDNNAYVYRNDITTLTSDYTGGVTLNVADTSIFPASVSTPLTVFVNGDDFTYTGKTATTFTGVAGLSSKPSGAQVYMNNVTLLVIRVDTGNTGINVAVGDTITVGTNTIMDTQNVNTASGSPPVITGDFGVATVAISGAVAADPVPVTAGVDSGDTLTITFDKPTNGYVIDTNNPGNTLIVTEPGVPYTVRTWPTISSAAWSNNNKTLTITFSGAGGTIVDGDRIRIAPGTIKDSSGTNNATPSTDPGFLITGSFGTAPVPRIQSIVAEDYSAGGPGIQNQDRIVFTFDNPTDGDTTPIATMFPLSGGASWGGLASPPHPGGNVQWIDSNRVLIVYVGGDCTIVPGTTQVNDNPASSGRNQYVESGTGTSPGSSASTSDDSIGWPRLVGGSFGAGVAGYLYDDPDTPVGIASRTIRFVVGGVDKGTSTTSATGYFSKNLIIAPGERFLVYVDGDATPNYGTTVTVKGPGDSIGDMNIYQNHITVRNHNGSATTNSDISAALGLGTFSDTDIRFSLTGSDITITATTPNQTLYILNNYTPGGIITIPATGHLRLGNGIFDPGTFTHSISGNWDDSAASGGFAPTGGTINFTGTGTIKQRSATTRNRFWNVIVSGGTRSIAPTDANSDGSVEIAGTAAGSLTVQTGATLQLGGGSTLRFASGGGLTVNAGGSLITSGTSATSRTTITRMSGATSYSLVINGTVKMNYYNVLYTDANGMQINNWVDGTSSLDFGYFDHQPAGLADTYAGRSNLLNFGGWTPPAGASIFLFDVTFNNSDNVQFARNIKSPSTGGAGTIKVLKSSGSITGASYENEFDATDRIQWSTNGQAVKNATTSKFYDTVAAAIAAASPNDILEPATNRVFTESFTVSKDIVLKNFVINGTVTLDAGKMYNCVIIGGVTSTSTTTTRTILNCTVDGNLTLTGTGATIKNCLYTGTLTATGATTATNLSATAADFVAPGAKDYHIKATSAARNAGTTLLAAEMPAVDFEGNPRPESGGTSWDIGADEFSTSNTAGGNQLGLTYFYQSDGATVFKATGTIAGFYRLSRPKAPSAPLDVSPVVYVAEGNQLHMFTVPTTSVSKEIVAAGGYPYTASGTIVAMHHSGAFRFPPFAPDLYFALAIDTNADGYGDQIEIVKDNGTAMSQVQPPIALGGTEQTRSLTFSRENYGGSDVLVIHVITNSGSGMSGTRIRRWRFNGSTFVEDAAPVPTSFANLEYRIQPTILAPLNYVYSGLTGASGSLAARMLSSNAAAYTVTAMAGAGSESAALVPLFVEQPSAVPSSDVANRLLLVSPSDGTKIYLYKYDTATPLKTVSMGALNSATQLRNSSFQNYLFLASGPIIHKMIRMPWTGVSLGDVISDAHWPLGDGTSTDNTDVNIQGNIIDGAIVRMKVPVAPPDNLCVVTDEGYVYVATVDASTTPQSSANAADGKWLADSPYRLPGLRGIKTTGNFVDGFYAVTQEGYIVNIRPF